MQTKMAESVEELAAIIKDYARKNRKLNDRVADIESKVLGKPVSKVVMPGAQAVKEMR